MTDTMAGSQPIYSTLASDPDLGEIVVMFVDEMPDRVANLRRRFEAGEWHELERAAHQLKGAAGSYGFNELTPCAARLEMALKTRSPRAEIEAALCDLIALCHNVRGGPAS